MNLDFETARSMVPAFLLEELSSEDREAFEAVLARSPALRGEVRAQAETLAGVAASCGEAGPAPARLWAGIEIAIRTEHRVASATPVARASESVAPAGRARRSLRMLGLPRWFWPAAAAALLVLNLVQWFAGHRAEPEARGASGAAVAETPAGRAPARHGAATATTGGSDSSEQEGPRSPADDADAAEAAAVARGTSPEGRAAGERDLARAYDELSRRYDALTELVVPVLSAALLESEQGGGVWTAELRSPTAATGQDAVGLWDRVRQLVPEEGVAILVDRWRFAGRAAVPITWMQPGGGVGVAADHSGVPAAAPPFAIALFNGEAGLGYLDLYNLPVVPAGSEMRVWIQGRDTTHHVPVGAVPPALSGGSGALVFRVPATVAEPSRIVITLEPAAPPAQPTGPVVIEGP